MIKIEGNDGIEKKILYSTKIGGKFWLIAL